MGYITKKSSVLGIKNCIDKGDKIRASPVCHPNPYGNGWGDPPQTPLGQIRRRQGESCSLERWEVTVGGEQRAVLWRWHHPSSDPAQPAPTLGKQSCPDSTEKAFAGILYVCLFLKTDGTLFKCVTEHFKKSTETTWTSLLFAAPCGRCWGFGRDPPRWLGTETHEEQADNPAKRYTCGSRETTRKWSETPGIRPARHHFTTELGLDAPGCPPLPSPSTPLASRARKTDGVKKATPEVLLHSSVPHLWCSGLLAGSAPEAECMRSPARNHGLQKITHQETRQTGLINHNVLSTLLSSVGQRCDLNNF